LNRQTIKPPICRDALRITHLPMEARSARKNGPGSVIAISASSRFLPVDIGLRLVATVGDLASIDRSRDALTAGIARQKPHKITNKTVQ